MDTSIHKIIDENIRHLPDQKRKIGSLDFEELKNFLNEICSHIAFRFNLCDANGKPRKAKIVDAIAKSSCLTCIAGTLSGQVAVGDIDDLYKECHKLAVNILVEELCNLISQMGHEVVISTEAELNYGKADILIALTTYGVNLKYGTKTLLIEVKTGRSVQVHQIIKYFLDERSDTIVLWRVRKRQVLVFHAQEIKPLLVEFMRMICLRGIRLLLTRHLQPCRHTRQPGYQPRAEDLEKMFQDYSNAVMETLPTVLQIILEKLDSDLTQK